MVDFDKDRDANLAAFELTGGAAKDGLTVRDYFAAKALPVLITEDGTCDFEMIARYAYEVADCMMLARDRKKPNTMTAEEAFGL